jgi:hypothetical protein
VRREALERLSGAVEATLERPQRGERARQRPTERGGQVFRGDRSALLGEERFDGDVPAYRRGVRAFALEQIGDGDAEGGGELDGGVELEVVVGPAVLDVLERARGQAAGLGELVARQAERSAAVGDQAAAEKRDCSASRSWTVNRSSASRSCGANVSPVSRASSRNRRRTPTACSGRSGA